VLGDVGAGLLFYLLIFVWKLGFGLGFFTYMAKKRAGFGRRIFQPDT